MGQRFTLGRSKRVRLKHDFRRAFESRCSSSDRFLILYAFRIGGSRVRLAVQVGRRFGNAVRRNRVKRLIREAFRLEQANLSPGFDVIVVPRPGCLGDLAQYRLSLRQLSERAARRWRAPPADSAADVASDRPA